MSDPIYSEAIARLEDALERARAAIGSTAGPSSPPEKTAGFSRCFSPEASPPLAPGPFDALPAEPMTDPRDAAPRVSVGLELLGYWHGVCHFLDSLRALSRYQDVTPT